MRFCFQIVQPPGCDDITGTYSDEEVEDDEAVLSDYENTPNKMELDRRANEVRSQTGNFYLNFS